MSTDVDTAALADRVRILEQLVARVSAAPPAAPAPAASPPIVIGPFDNVPAPGSPIRSDWAQDITTAFVNLTNRGLSTVFIRSQEQTVTTDQYGLGTISWGFNMPAPPIVSVQVKSSFAYNLMVTIYGVTTTNVSVQVSQITQAPPVPWANAGVTLHLLAIHGGIV